MIERNPPEGQLGATSDQTIFVAHNYTIYVVPESSFLTNEFV